MKKGFFVVVFVMLASAVFAQRTALSTSDGVYYYVSILYQGQNKGQETYDKNIAASIRMGDVVYSGEKLTKGQWEAVNHMLNRYQTTKGDTYYIDIGLNERITSYIIFICEFTSNTQYNYWTYKAHSRPW